jgi:hypothetical protein
VSGAPDAADRAFVERCFREAGVEPDPNEIAFFTARSRTLRSLVESFRALAAAQLSEHVAADPAGEEEDG